MKICPKCSLSHDKKQCPFCKKEIAKRYYDANKEKKSEYAKEYSRINREKINAVSKAWADKNRDKVRASTNKWYTSNPIKAKIATDSWRILNAVKVSNTRQSYRDANKKRLCLEAKEYVLANKEKVQLRQKIYREKNKEKIAVVASLYKKNNTDKVNLLNQNRRALRKKVGGVLSKGLAEKLYILQKGKCPCCNQKLGKDYHMDHIMPMKLGGSNTDDNIQLLKAKCNMEKSAKDPFDFMQSKGFIF
jgi:hypothetical protein